MQPLQADGGVAAGDEQDDRPEVPASPVPKRDLPQPKRAPRQAARRVQDALPQRQLALELRYYIDLVPKLPFIARDEIRYLLRTSPHGAKSKHIEHNLGKRRMEWLRKEGLIVAEKNEDLQKKVGGKGIAIKGAVTKADTEMTPADLTRAREIPGVKSNTKPPSQNPR
jgi:hypothetical protein